MSIADLPKEDRRRLASDPGTDPEVLAELASDLFLAGALVDNPSTPPPTRESLLRDLPHLRSSSESAPAISAEDALIRASQRQQSANRRYTSEGATQGRYTPQVVLGTNGFAITSLVLALVGGSLLAIVFGHVARAQIARTGEQGDGMALAGLLIGYLSIGVLTLYILVAALT